VFERLDPDAHAVMTEAIAEARRWHDGYLGTEHVLIAFAANPTVLPEQVRERLAVTADTLRDALERETDGRVASDEALLATLGIDLGEIRRQTEATFGPAALDRVAVRRAPRWRRRRWCFPMLADGLGVMPRVKRALERACARRPGLVNPQGLLLGIVEDDEAMATRLLVLLGIDVSALRIALAAAVDT
jgi:ATP-dependent Clp protease ATP-binding subunit ClpA